MVIAPVRRVVWPRSARIIRSIHPPIDLFEDIADPADWEALASAKAKFNPHIRDSIGDLIKVPVARRVTGPGARWVMAPFVDCSPLRPGRFSDGTFGLYHAGDRTRVALAETIHYHTRTMLAAAEDPGWTSQFRELIGSVNADIDDVSGMADLLHLDDFERFKRRPAAVLRKDSRRDQPSLTNEQTHQTGEAPLRRVRSHSC